MTRRERGSLERGVLEVLWAADAPVTSADVRAGFPENDRPALTTLLTVLDRLEHKGLVVRTGTPRAALFAASHSESESAAGEMARILERSGDRASALLRFAGSLRAADVDVLRQALEQDR